MRYTYEIYLFIQYNGIYKYICLTNRYKKLDYPNPNPFGNWNPISNLDPT